MNTRALTNWIGWVVGSVLIITAIYMVSGLPTTLAVTGIWVILTGFGYHTIGVVTGVHEEISKAEPPKRRGR